MGNTVKYWHGVRGLTMLKHYLMAFLIGWAFNYALDVNAVTRSTVAWVQHGWLAPFFDAAPAPTTKRT